MIPKRYLFASMFIAAMLMLLAVVQGPRSRKEGGVAATSTPMVLNMDSFETLADTRLLDGWSPRYQGALDPDQGEAWPFGGGFGAPWEPASAYLEDQGVALNGPGGRSEVILWHGLEWRHYRFDAPLSSARLDPARGNRLLVTLQRHPGRFETRLLEVPEGRVLWSTDSGPWSRFSWDGQAVLLGLSSPAPESVLLLSALPVDRDPQGATLASWDEKEFPVPKGLPTRADQLWDDGKDLPGARLAVPWSDSFRMWFPRKDRLWVTQDGRWTLWGLQGDTWRRLATGAGVLACHPPLAMGLVDRGEDNAPRRQVSLLDRAEWRPVPPEAPPWPAYDAAWTWISDQAATTAWDTRWGPAGEALPRERQREAILRTFRQEWRTASDLRPSVRGWLGDGPEVGLRESRGVAWVWVGDRILMVRLVPGERLRAAQGWMKGK